MNASLVGAAAHNLGSFLTDCYLVPGRGHLVDGLGKLARWIGGDCAVASPWPGVRFETDLTDRIQRQMWGGIYEPHIRKCLNVLLEPGAVYFDVGAHIGFHAAFAAYRVGPQGQVFAFEADPVVYERLVRNLSQFSWAQTMNAAVWEQRGSVTFDRSSTPYESGWGRVSRVRDSKGRDRVIIPSVAIDDLTQKLKLTRWDVMKLDAEGSELAVLRGAQSALGKFRPIIIFEINTSLLEQSGDPPLRVAEFLLERGYHLFRLEYRRLIPWQHGVQREFCDALCLPDSHAEELLKRLRRDGFRQID